MNTRQGMNIYRHNAPTRFGGDLWNDAKVARIVFGKLPNVDSFSICHRTSGLYCYIVADNGNRYHVTDAGNVRVHN